MSTTSFGTLYGVGVGPGDPELLTLAAVAALKRVQVVFAASSSKNVYSLALNVVKDHLPPSAEVRKLDFPMTKDQKLLEEAWEENARAVIDVLASGGDAAFITIGDPLTYSTYGYLARTVTRLAPQVKLETIPGVTAYNAAAARLNLPLAEGEQSLLILSGVCDPQDITRLASLTDNLVVLKAYHNYDRIVDAIEAANEHPRTYLVSRCGLPEEVITPDAGSRRGSKPHYLSLIIAKRDRQKERG